MSTKRTYIPIFIWNENIVVLFLHYCYITYSNLWLSLKYFIQYKAHTMCEILYSHHSRRIVLRMQNICISGFKLRLETGYRFLQKTGNLPGF